MNIASNNNTPTYGSKDLFREALMAETFQLSAHLVLKCSCSHCAHLPTYQWIIDYFIGKISIFKSVESGYHSSNADKVDARFCCGARLKV